MFGLADERAGGLEVALAREDRVGVHPVTCTGTPPGQAEPNTDTGTQE